MERAPREGARRGYGQPEQPEHEVREHDLDELPPVSPPGSDGPHPPEASAVAEDPR